ncbi:DUF1800 domain-containing protein [Longimicrobium sp.]|uniref:DUF1800 domain-containing protein n=1 Tax=Longimicrobium sp. TaxID=2029185 RepID=UPI002CACC486|nr:DUF1800 domain-containing protein [Longimicrobium sp.]HSU16027.1 DUF1800 domain-containing protein [Longimicrobium sp.]
MTDLKPNHLPSPARRAAATGGILAGALLLAGLVPAQAIRAFAAPHDAVAEPMMGRAAMLRPVLARRPADAPPTREDSARAVHLLQRATFGARPRDVAEVLRMGREAWLDRQLHPERIDDSALQRRLAAFPAAAMSPGELLAAYPRPKANPAQRAQRDSARRAREEMRGDSGMVMNRGGADESTSARPRARRRAAAGDTAAMAMRADGAGFAAGRRQARPRGPQAILVDAAGARLQRAVYSERQLEEVMTDFWFNHFNVFFGKNQDRYLVTAYEREAIRPHVFGKFRDLLEASAKHPAMLVYLDNAQSMVPDSVNPNAGQIDAARRRLLAMTPAQRAEVYRRRGVDPAVGERMLAGGDSGAGRRRARGINENYARELMELHTLGVDGGYTQHDVIEVARALTGWTIQRGGRRAAGAEPAFVFRPAMHDPGEKTVLGHRLPAGRGIEDGEAVLDLLARHPATARHIALQLAQRFVADDPPPSLVDHLAAVFTRTDGDLREVTRALFLSPEFNDPRWRDAKVKSPLEFVAGALRATGADVSPSRGLLQALRQMGQMPYAATPPTGYPNTSAEWTNSGAMLGRMNFALALAAGRVDGVRLDEQRFALALATRDADARIAALARMVMPGAADPRLVRTIAEDVRQQAQLDERQRAARALGLLLGSPDFQRR